MVDLESSVPEESEDEIRAPAEASNAAIDLGAEVADAGGHSTAQVLLDMAMTSLVGIQIWGIGRKPVHFDLRMCAKILFDHRSAMRTEPVPNHDKGPRNIALEVAEGGHNILPADCVLKVALVDAARQREPDGRRECPALADMPQDGGVPHRSPGGSAVGAA